MCFLNDYGFISCCFIDFSMINDKKEKEKCFKIENFIAILRNDLFRITFDTPYYVFKHLQLQNQNENKFAS